MNNKNKVSGFKFNSNKINIEKKIEKYESEKSDKLFELGNLAYAKIREGILDDTQFKDICDQIKNLDLNIYESMLEIKKLENVNDVHTCECGYVINRDEKFCPQCGKKINKEKKKILCESCLASIDEDSKFCVCCGFKVNKNNSINLEKDECMYDYELYNDYEDNTSSREEESAIDKIGDNIFTKKEDNIFDNEIYNLDNEKESQIDTEEESEKENDINLSYKVTELEDNNILDNEVENKEL